LNITNSLREAGVSSMCLSATGKLAKKISYAEKLEINSIIIAGESERDSQTLSLKNLETREQVDKLSLSQALELISTSTD